MRPRQDGEAKPYKKKAPAHTRSGDKNTRSGKKPAPQQAKRTPGKVEPLPVNEVKVNNKVKVKLGQALVNATITEVNKDDVHVELVTGMQVKTKADSLFIV